MELLLIVSFIFGGAQYCKIERTCTTDEAFFAESAISLLEDWETVYRFYNVFCHCNDAAIAEGFSDSITFLLAEKWETTGVLIKLYKDNFDFGIFIINQIAEATLVERRNQIANNALKRCPKGGAIVCKKMIEKIKQVKVEMK